MGTCSPLPAHPPTDSLPHRPQAPTRRALDLGCAVGGSTFALARAYGEVHGLELSDAFVDAAQRLQVRARLWAGRAPCLRMHACMRAVGAVRFPTTPTPDRGERTNQPTNARAQHMYSGRAPSPTASRPRATWPRPSPPVCPRAPTPTVCRSPWGTCWRCPPSWGAGE